MIANTLVDIWKARNLMQHEANPMSNTIDHEVLEQEPDKEVEKEIRKIVRKQTTKMHIQQGLFPAAEELVQMSDSD
jgi:hypothetical protein